jgi:hypothetical protein
MQLITQAPVVLAAIQYLLLYLLFGGGLFGAVVIYAVAKALERQRMVRPLPLYIQCWYQEADARYPMK